MADFSRPVNTERFTGLLNKSRLHGILDASNFDATDNVFLFLHAIVDSTSGLYHSAKMMIALTDYGDVVNFPFKRHFNV